MHPMPDRPQSDTERISAALQSILDFTPGEAQYLSIRKFMNEDPEQFIPKLELISKGLGERIGKIAVKAATILRFPVERIQSHVDRICKEGWTLEVARLLVFGCPDLLGRTEADVDATFSALTVLIPKSDDRRFFMSVKPRICMIPGERITACAKLTRWDDDPEALWRAIVSKPMPEPTPVAVVEPIPPPKVVTPRPSPPPVLRPITRLPQPAPVAVRPVSTTRPSTTTMRAIPRADETPLPQSSRKPLDRPPTSIRPKKERPSLPERRDDDDEFYYILNWPDVVRSILWQTRDGDWNEQAFWELVPDILWIWGHGSNGSKALTSLCRWLNLRRAIERPVGADPASLSEEQLTRLKFVGQILRLERLRDILRLEQRTLEFRMAVLRRFIDLDFVQDPTSLLKPWESLPPEELRYRVNEIVDRDRSPAEQPYTDMLLQPTREKFIESLELALSQEKRRSYPT